MMVFVITKCKKTAKKLVSFALHLDPAFDASFALTFSSDQNWPHWHHLAEQPRGAVVCPGLVG